MESGSLIDLDDHQQDAHAQQSVDKPVYEVSLSGHGLEGLPAGSSAVTADSTLHNADPFAGLEAMAPIQASDSAYNDVVTPDPASAAQQGHVQNSQLHHEPVQHSQQHTQDSSSAVSLKAAAERAAHTSDVLQRHSIEQGECNAKLRWVNLCFPATMPPLVPSMPVAPQWQSSTWHPQLSCLFPCHAEEVAPCWQCLDLHANSTSCTPAFFLVPAHPSTLQERPPTPH